MKTATPRFGGKRKGATCLCGWCGPGQSHPPALCKRERAAHAAMMNREPEHAGARHGNTSRDYRDGSGDGHGDTYGVPGSESVRVRRTEY